MNTCYFLVVFGVPSLELHVWEAMKVAKKKRGASAKPMKVKTCRKTGLKRKVRGDLSKGFFTTSRFQFASPKKPLPPCGLSNGLKILPFGLRLPKTKPLELVCVGD